MKYTSRAGFSIAGAAFLLLVMLGVAAGSRVAFADDQLPTPTSEVLLRVDGSISARNTDDAALFDRGMLEGLGMHTMKTSSNPFEPGKHEFKGVLLRDILNAVGASGDTIIAGALDGYKIKIPKSDAYDYDVLVAMIWNGKVMRVRNRGPLWVLYPIDQHKELNSAEYSGRSIWQLNNLTIQ